ncbi:MAG: hypothetical protein ACJ71M_01255 [Nitrososphaeraceae archaeon]
MKTNVQCVERMPSLEMIMTRKMKNGHRLEDSPISDIIVEQINVTCFIFDTSNCALIFKKLMDIYGSSFADQ